MTPEAIEAVAGLVFPTLGVLGVVAWILAVVGLVMYVVESK